MTDNTNVTDITPDCSPVALARDMVQRATEGRAKAGAYILLTGDDRLLCDCAGIHKKDLLWVFTRAIHELMDEETDG